jgi:hypothetical protein
MPARSQALKGVFFSLVSKLHLPKFPTDIQHIDKYQATLKERSHTHTVTHPCLTFKIPKSAPSPKVNQAAKQAAPDLVGPIETLHSKNTHTHTKINRDINS